MSRPSYPSDITDKQWTIIEPLLPKPKFGGGPRHVDLREVVNTIFYFSRSGCAWRFLPHDFPPWGTVHWYYRLWRIDGTWQKIHEQKRAEVRKSEGRESTLSYAIIDSQSIKTTLHRGIRGYDAAKKVTGRKRHLVVDTLGLLLVVMVHAANIQDRDGAKLVMDRLAMEYFPQLQLIWALSFYAGQLIGWVLKVWGWVLEIVKRPTKSQGFIGLKKTLGG